MKPTDDEEFRKFSYGAFLEEIGTKVMYDGKETISKRDLHLILQAEFGFCDKRTYSNKIEMLAVKGYIIQANKTAFRVTERAFSRIRKMKGVPEANHETPNAEASTSSTGQDLLEPCDAAADVDSYLQALQRGGQQA